MDNNTQASKELGISCMLNTEVGAVLAVIRRGPESSSQFYHHPDDTCDIAILHSLKTLRNFLFNPQQEWRKIDPSLYLSPFLDVIQSDDIPATATAVALQSILKILRLGIFDQTTIGAKDAINSTVTAITGCHLERSNSVSEEAVMMRILQVLTAIMRHRASVLLTDHATCTIVNTCFQVVQQSASRGDLLQRSARYTMHELIQIIFSRLPEIEVKDWENSDSDTEDNTLDSGYGIRSAVDIFHFLCSLLNVVEVMETDGLISQNTDENVQLFALVLINSAIELSGDSIGKHPKLLRMIQDDLFHHLIHYGACSSPLVLSMISSTVLNLYHFLRKSIRLQLEAFFSFVLFRTATPANSLQLQEVAVEGLINFCRQPMFIIEAYVNYDCDPTFQNVFEETGKLLCKYAFPTGGLATSIQIQALEGLAVIFHNIADQIDKENDSSPSGPYPVEISGYQPFWEEKCKGDDDVETWVDYVRVRKVQKKKILIAGNHFNRDEKKGLQYLKISKLISEPPNPKAYAVFFRYTPRLDKVMIGDYLGDPDEFNIKVLKEFTNTFQFAGMILDTALRTYLEAFRLPGESQKIQRVLEAFSERFYDQQSSEIFVTKDAVFILCYSLIMLNTDLHNPQVKKKMTEDEFIRNNRQINGGNDLPREYLSELFHSILTHPIAALPGQSGAGPPVEMNPNRWIQLINRGSSIQPFILCDFNRRLGRDMFATIAGPSVATLAAIFEHSDEEEILHECIDSLFSIARIAQYGLEDTLDELVSSFCKFTTLLNPYASAEETLYAFGNDMKPKMATLAVFTIANTFKDSIRGGWRTILDCLLKLRKLKLLPQSVIEPDNAASDDFPVTRKSDFGVVFPSHDPKFGAAGKGQKFSTPIEEEETVGFCWDLICAIASANTHRFSSFWPHYHDYLLEVTQLPLFSPIPFAEKAIVALMKMCLKLLALDQFNSVEELLLKSIVLGWKSLLHLLSVTGRHADTYDKGAEALITLMSDETRISPTNYAYCIDCAFGFVALRNSPVENNLKIMDLMANSAKLLVQWHISGYSDPGSNASFVSTASSSSAVILVIL